MVTRLLLLNFPPVNEPPILSVELTPGVELAKLTVVVTEAPGARLPRPCGNGVPLVAPSFAVVTITLFAVSEPMFLIVTVADTFPAVLRVNVEVTSSLTCPHGVVQTG